MNNYNMDVLVNFRKLIYNRLGIYVNDSKIKLLEIKLNKLMNKEHYSSLSDLYHILKNSDKKEFEKFVNSITTNTTQFFREKIHFQHLSTDINSKYNSGAIKEPVKIWSAGCSNGMEPVTIAISLLETTPIREFKILATDINTKVLKKAIEGVYTSADCEDLPDEIKGKYFERVHGNYQVKKVILQTISYRYFNLNEEFPFKNRFDYIFCRNVMIYFNNESKTKLINKFFKYLKDNGLFFVGLSENLLGLDLDYINVGVSAYKKERGV